MKKSNFFKNLLGGGAIVALTFTACQKDSVQTTQRQESSGSLDQRVIEFRERMKHYSNGGADSRTGDPIAPEDLLADVELTMNHDYAQFNQLGENFNSSEKEFEIPISSGLISGQDASDFFDDVLDFASDHFNNLSASTKVPKLYDVEINSITSTLVTFNVTSVITHDFPIGNWADKSFTSGDDWLATESKCAIPYVWGAPKEISRYVNWNQWNSNLPDYMIIVGKNLIPVGAPNLNSSDPTPNDNVLDYDLYFLRCCNSAFTCPGLPSCSTINFSEVRCLEIYNSAYSTYEMDFYLDNATNIAIGLVPSGKLFGLFNMEHNSYSLSINLPPADPYVIDYEAWRGFLLYGQPGEERTGSRMGL